MKERLEQLLSHKKSLQYYADILTKEFNKLVTADEVRDLKKTLLSSIPIGERPLTTKELEEVTGIDNSTSFLKESKQRSYKGNTWTYSVDVIHTQESVNHLEEFKEFLSKFNSNYVPRKVEKDGNLLGDNSIMISLTDFHLDKLTLDGSTVNQKKKIYRATLSNLIYRVYRSFNISEIVFVIGNDFFHTDNFHNQTTKGTQQEVSTSWYNAYEEGFELMVWAIDFLRNFSDKVKVVYVPSNHSRTKEYFMAHALETFFKSDEGVTFDRSASYTKVHTFGNNFFGFHHGDTEVNRLPLYFASKYGKEYGNSANRFIFLGDKHHKKNYKFSIGNREIEGIRIEFLPSLTGTDRWHDQSLFDLAIRSGVVQVFDHDKGFRAEFEERVSVKEISQI